MRIHELRNAEGVPHAFEVSNLLLSRARACKIAESIPGATVMRRSRLFRDKDDFCEFRIYGETFIIEELFGDNSRYWVGPNQAGRSASLALVRARFEEHKSWVALARTLSILGLAVLMSIAFVGATRFIRQDKCMDSGGRWQDKESMCVLSAKSRLTCEVSGTERID